MSVTHYIHIIIYSEEIYLPYLPFLLTLKDTYNTFLLGQVVAQIFIHLKQNQIQDAFFIENSDKMYVSHTYSYLEDSSTNTYHSLNPSLKAG